MREWNASRKIKASGLAVKSCIKFSLAGKRYRQTFLAAAIRAKELENKGIDWFQSPEAIAKAEKEILLKKQSSSYGKIQLPLQGPKLSLIGL
jgi:hypothetical protein